MRLYIFLTTIVGLMILLSYGGVNTSTGYVLTYLNILDAPENFQSSNFYLIIVGVFAAVAVGGVVIGFFTKTSPESYLLGPLAGVLVLFVGDIISIIVYTNANFSGWSAKIIGSIMSMLAVGYTITVVDWWRGTA